MLSPRYVDTREADERRIPLERGGFVLRALSAGDVWFPEAGGGTVGLELKKIGQLLKDLQSGQLHSQLARLQEAVDFPVLGIEGHWALDSTGHLTGSRYQWTAVWKALLSLQDECATRLVLTTSAEGTVQMVLDLAEYYAKERHASVARHPSGDPRIATLCRIDGVGTEKAKALLTAYPTLAHIATASVDQLLLAEGIGPKLARRAYTFFHSANGNTPL